jgi:protocatechuate 3,4-dioxygenase beta subunit
MRAAWFLSFALTAAAQTAGTGQTGGITGVVTDAVTHVPVKKALVTVNIAAGPIGRYDGPQSAITDASGSFTINNVQPGTYRLIFQHQNYPQNRLVAKNVEVKAGEIAGPVNAELIPGAVVSGHIVDEDGDPLSGCNVLVQPANRPNTAVGSAGSNEEGEYRAHGIAPGKYIVRAQCMQSVFQPRPFSAGPDPPAARAYPLQYYPLTSEPKEAQLVELTPGNEKSGIDFRMAPAAVTQVRGAFSPTGADWHGLNPMVQLLPAAGATRASTRGPNLDQGKGTFEFQQVSPGSYFLVAFSVGNDESRIGAVQKIEVGDKPVDVSLELRHGMELNGKVEIEQGGSSTQPVSLNQIRVQLMPQYQIGLPVPQTQVDNDGGFVLKGVIPGAWQVRVEGHPAFVKSAWLGNADVTNSPMDLSGGVAGTLRLMMSTNMATIRGSAPAGQMVFAQMVNENTRFQLNRAAQVDQTGQYKLDNLAPGKYRLMATDPGGPMPDEGGQEVTVHEGETVMVDLKAQPGQ